MSTPESRLDRLRAFNSSVRNADPDLREESADLKEVREVGVSPESVRRAIEQESIVMRRQRPVLAIRDDSPVLAFRDAADSEIWQGRLEKAGPLLVDAAKATGRIELAGGRLDWVGTGWLVKPTVIVTNRHVAIEFAERNGQGFRFRMGSSGEMAASIDFKEEIDVETELTFNLVRPLHIEPTPGPDVAFFEVEISSGDYRLAKPIALAQAPRATENVATIGYPAYDSRIREPELMEEIYGRVYNKKRLAPGAVTRVDDKLVWHNCTTLGGCSGSAVLDLDSGQALGLHFSGSFLESNYAVRSDVVSAILSNLGRPAPRPDPAPRPRENRSSGTAVAVHPPTPRRTTQSGQHQTTLTVPLQITVSVGIGGSVPPFPRPDSAAPRRGTDSALIEADSEAVAEDYRDRRGYDPAFIGAEFAVPLPVVERDADDVLPIGAPGAPGAELRYEHFSVVMSRSRRMCFFSAVNIDGRTSGKSVRRGWRWDPRLPKAQQIMNECYGDPPRFSRGHMTRREDPAWGNAASIERGNSDSMHVTNATPQMQAFNSPIWLALEDYALDHAREDDMRISVFTGPYFDESDPIYDGVQVPRAFWKVIAFIHDETGELCATGYEMDQRGVLPSQEEFIFGGFDSPHLGVAAQVSIASIEERSGISFGGLAAIDGFASQKESVLATIDGCTSQEESVSLGRVASKTLGMLEQIRFLPGKASKRGRDEERQGGVERHVQVFFGSDRTYSADAARLGERFGTERGELKLGRLNVSIPPGHETGEVERPSWLRLQFRENPSKHVMLTELMCDSEADFLRNLGIQLAANDNPSAFVFVHGYNVSFEDAALRTAQIALDVGLASTPLFYSWPSKDGLARYTVDEANAEWTRPNLLKFLELIAENSPARDIVVIAHSMGSRPVTWALDQLMSRRPELREKFSELVLAAPDIDAAVFQRDILPALAPLHPHVTLYASSKDRALAASKFVHGSPRLGESGESLVVAAGMDTIDASVIETDFLAHSYLVSARPLLMDLSVLAGKSLRASDRSYLQRRLKGGLAYWAFSA